MRVRKSEIIMNTVEAWSKDYNGKLLRNLKHGDIWRSRSEARPLVFGGTYPIDEPIHRKGYQEPARKTDFTAYIEPNSFPIDQPIQNLANWNSENVKRRTVHNEYRREEDISDTDITDSEDCGHVKKQ